MSRQTHTRRTVLRGIGAGTALLVGGVGAVAAEGSAGLRVAHASPAAPAVDITYDGGTLLFDGVERFTSSGYAVVPAGDYDVEVRPDTEDNDGEIVNTPVPAVTLEGRSTYTIFAIGYLTPDGEPGDEAFRLLPTLDAGAPPRGDGDEGEDEEDETEGRGRGNGRGR